VDCNLVKKERSLLSRVALIQQGRCGLQHNYCSVNIDRGERCTDLTGSVRIATAMIVPLDSPRHSCTDLTRSVQFLYWLDRQEFTWSSFGNQAHTLCTASEQRGPVHYSFFLFTSSRSKNRSCERRSETRMHVLNIHHVLISLQISRRWSVHSRHDGCCKQRSKSCKN